MKALILAGGRGKRLEGISEDLNKCMLKLNNKPLIEYSLVNAASTKVDEIVIVVGYKAEDIINGYGINYMGKPIKYVIQQPQKGIVHAIECAKEALSNDDFILFLGDEILINPRHNLMIEKFEKENLFGACGILIEKNRSKIGKTYSIFHSKGDKIVRLIEKPKRALNDFQGTGNCIFRNEILSYIERTPINQQRGEKELPDLIQLAIDESNEIKSFVICDRYMNINRKQDLQCNQKLK